MESEESDSEPQEFDLARTVTFKGDEWEFTGGILGSGAFGCVYDAECIRTGALAAVKVRQAALAGHRALHGTCGGHAAGSIPPSTSPFPAPNRLHPHRLHPNRLHPNRLHPNRLRVAGRQHGLPAARGKHSVEAEAALVRGGSVGAA